MAARGALGVEIDVALVPRRETGLSPFEVMLSESQERMLLLIEPTAVDRIRRHFAHWDLPAEVIGHVTDDGVIRVRDGRDLVAELPIPLLTDEVFAYDLQAAAPTAPSAGEGRREGAANWSEALLRLIGSPNLRSKRFAYRQYDSTVQANTVLGPGQAGAAVVRVDGTNQGLALTTDCNPRYMRLDPRRGAMQAVAEAARNLACVGAAPIAVTDCLNFGNPEKPAVAWQLTEAIHGLAEACTALGVPIVSGNVSLYNETAGRAIPPTPTVGMVGLLDDASLTVPAAFSSGDAIVLLGDAPQSLGAGEYAGDGPFPRFDLDAERRLADVLRALAGQRLIHSAQDISDGGLAIAVAECALLGATGATLKLDGIPEVALFSEDQGRAVVTCAPTHTDAVFELASAHGVAAVLAGETAGDRLVIGDLVELELEALRAAWDPPA
jgi:phosphoribosylformylglycinamidine synthase